MQKYPKNFGRPSKLTPDIVTKLEAAFCNDLNVTEACFMGGISRETYYRHLRAGGDFRDKMERAQRYPILIARRALFTQIKNGDGNLALRFLERREPQRYRLRRGYEPESQQLIRVVLPGAAQHPRINNSQPSSTLRPAHHPLCRTNARPLIRR